MGSSPPTLGLFVIFVITTTTVFATAEKETHIRVYFHEIYNTTSFVVVSLENPNSTFGNLRVYDNALREGLDPNSTLIGRAQGIAVSASLEDRALLTTSNFVFTAGKYNGSTLSIFGRDDATGIGTTERTVIGGSGQFRMVRGYVLSEIFPTSLPNYVVIQFDFYIKHD